MSSTTWQNWGRTVLARPQRVAAPRTREEVAAVVRSAAADGMRVKAVGAGHSFSAIAEPVDILMTLDHLSGIVSVDSEARLVTLGAGTRLRAIPALLEPLGLAMENLGDIDAQSIAGAISTGTHGTGARFRGIAGQVAGALLVTGEGALLRVDSEHHPELLPAIALGLGALGILVEVTIRCVDAFDLRAVERPEPLDAVLDELDARVADADHFEFFWFPHTATALTKTNARVAAGRDRAPLPPLKRWFDDVCMANGVFRATCAVGRAAPAAVPLLNRAAARLSGERTYSDRSPRVFASRRTVRFVEMEYAVPAELAATAVREVRALIERSGWRISFPVEVRFAAADALWLSTAFERPSAYIAVHRVRGEDPRPYFAAVESVLRAMGGRPHWGKMHTRRAVDLTAAYPRFHDFLAVRARLDPAGVFRNPELDRVLDLDR